MTQRQRIRKHLEEYGKITSLQAANKYGILRLSARIWDLRHKDGLNIISNPVSGVNRYGDKVYFDEYILVKR